MVTYSLPKQDPQRYSVIKRPSHTFQFLFLFYLNTKYSVIYKVQKRKRNINDVY